METSSSTLTALSNGEQTPEQVHTCCKRIYDRDYWDRRGHLCGKKAKMQHEGSWYCGVHDPVARKTKREALDAIRNAEFEETIKLSRIRNAAPDMLAALQLILDWADEFCRTDKCPTYDAPSHVRAAIAKALGGNSDDRVQPGDSGGVA